MRLPYAGATRNPASQVEDHAMDRTTAAGRLALLIALVLGILSISLLSLSEAATGASTSPREPAHSSSADFAQAFLGDSAQESSPSLSGDWRLADGADGPTPSAVPPTSNRPQRSQRAETTSPSSCADFGIELTNPAQFAVRAGDEFTVTQKISNPTSSAGNITRVQMEPSSRERDHLTLTALSFRVIDPEQTSPWYPIRDDEGGGSFFHLYETWDRFPLADYIEPGITYELQATWSVSEDVPFGTWLNLTIFLSFDAAGDGQRIACDETISVLANMPRVLLTRLVPLPKLFVSDSSPSPGEDITVTATFRNPGEVFQGDLTAQFFDSADDLDWLEPISDTLSYRYWQDDLRTDVDFTYSVDSFSTGHSFRIAEMNPRSVVSLTFRARVKPNVTVGTRVSPSVCIRGYHGVLAPLRRTHCNTLELTISAPPGPVEARIRIDDSRLPEQGPAIVTVEVYNYHTTTLSDTVLHIEMPVGLTVEGTRSSLFYDRYQGQDARRVPQSEFEQGVSLPGIPPGASVSIEFHAVPSSEEVYGEQVAIRTSVARDGKVLVRASESIRVHRQIDHSLSISSPEEVSPGSSVRYLVSLTLDRLGHGEAHRHRCGDAAPGTDGVQPGDSPLS